MRLKKRTKIDRPNKVYNLHVKNNHNYVVAGGAVVSNCHQAKAKTLSEIMSGPASNVPFRFGCTGTVPKEDIWQQQIRGIIGEKIFTLKAWELQEKGVLASAEVYQITFEDSKNPEYIQAAKAFEDWADQLNWLFNCKPRTEMIASIIEEAAIDEGNVLTLIPYKKHGKVLHELIDGSISIDGDVKGAKRQVVYEKFGAGDNGVLIATFGIASTGLDIPRIHVLGFIEPGKKFEKIIQTVGRGLRKASDKDHIIIFDFAGDSDFAKKHATERRRLYKEAKIPCHVETISYVN
jgi:superfamily II DNA or RNA helicase